MVEKNNLTLENAIKKVEEIVKLLENDDIDLPELMKRYDEGIDLINYCHSELNKAEEKVKIIKLKENEIVFEEFK